MSVVNVSFEIFFLGQFFHVTSIMKDFGKPCFIHGAIFTSAVGVVAIIAVVLVGILINIILK